VLVCLMKRFSTPIRIEQALKRSVNERRPVEV
jgi:hypothetical protein